MQFDVMQCNEISDVDDKESIYINFVILYRVYSQLSNFNFFNYLGI